MTQGGVAPQARPFRGAEIGNAVADVRRYDRPVQVDPQQEIEAREIELLTARVRAGLVVWLGAAIVFVASDLFLGLAQPAVVHVTRLSNVAALVGYLYLRRPRQRWQIEATAVSVMLVGIAVLSVCVAVLPDTAAALILLHRFAAAGAAIRYQNLHQKTTEEVLALDIALKGNDSEWVETLPPEITQHLQLALYYGHFMCHVFHQDYIFRKGTDLAAIKKQMLARLEAKGAKFPAEHNVGHMYEAEPVLKAFYQQLDPTNTFNPGIGKTEKRRQDKPDRPATSLNPQ